MSKARQHIDAFYPIVPDLGWLERIVPLGVKTVQLRLKNATPAEVARQVAAGRDLCRRHGCTFIVNDYWQAAIDTGCDWVHLGQEDLAEANVAAIKAGGLKLGISTHSHQELAIALAAKPDYVALGPIWETKLKAMKWAPQGLDKIRDWRARIGDMPFVAIGGITPERATSVIEAGADSAAVITDFFTHADPEGRIRLWLKWAEEQRRGA